VSKTAEASAAHYYPGEYEIVPNGVDTERFSPTVEPFEAWREPGVVNLLFVARLDPRKGLDVLIAAMPEVVARTGGKVRLLVIGDSVLRGKFEGSVPAAIRDRVKFLGHVPSRDLPRWYRTGDVFVSPATGLESFGIVLIEAMASGCVTVASDLPGFRSVITPGVDGLMVPPGDAGALAEMLVTVVRDEHRRRHFSAAGRERALTFAWPRITDQIEQVYADVMARRGASRLAIAR
jgi:phosphatidylinositol alpha-mannosyltransferase